MVLKKNDIDTPIFMIGSTDTIDEDLNSSSPPLLANYFEFFGASR